MKKAIFYLFIGLIMPMQAQWFLQNSGTTESLNELYVINSDTVVVVGNNGTILRTINGGTDWVSINSYANVNLRNVKFYDTQTGYISANNGVVLKTVNGGENWQIITLNTTEDLTGLSVQSSTHLYVAGTNGLLKESTDGGTTWNTINTPTAEHIKDIQFFGDTGYILSNEYGEFSDFHLYKTTDHGNTWEQKNGYIFSMFFVNADYGVLGSIGQCLVTTDGADTSTPTDYNVGNDGVIDVEISETNDIWTCGINMLTCDAPSFISKTESLNNSYQTSYTEFAGYRIDFYHNTGYMLDGWYNIYKNGTGTNTSGYDELKKDAYIQVYPNPATDFIQVNLQNNSSANYYQISGMQGKTIVPKTKLTEQKIDVSKLANNIYFLQIFTEKDVYNTKFIIKR